MWMSVGLTGGVAMRLVMVHAAAGRCSGLHFGTFDYSAGLGIAAAQQSLEHPAADEDRVRLSRCGLNDERGSTGCMRIDRHGIALRASSASGPGQLIGFSIAVDVDDVSAGRRCLHHGQDAGRAAES